MRTLLFTLPVGCRQVPKSLNRQTESGHNLPDFVRDVRVYLDPNLEQDGSPVHGLAEYPHTIVLREWCLDVLVHEILHIALNPILDQPTPVERYEISDHGHWMVVPAELALAPLIHRLAAEDAARSSSSVASGVA